jgi:DNA polymerase I
MLKEKENTNKVLLLDCDFLCHRAKYISLKNEGHMEIPFHFLTFVEWSVEKFNPYAIVFCWDSKHSYRKKLNADYKKTRQKDNLTQEEIEELIEYRKQVIKTRKFIKTNNFANTYIKKGLEADDLIASVCKNINDEYEAIIISEDHDLYQLLSYNVSMYSLRKQKMYTQQTFFREYQIHPNKWALVKCIAGCSSDNIKGIVGIGEKTIIKYIQKKLPKKSKKYAKIEAEKLQYISKNKALVKLPFKKTPVLSFKKDTNLNDEWTTKYINETLL